MGSDAWKLRQEPPWAETRCANCTLNRLRSCCPNSCTLILDCFGEISHMKSRPNQWTSGPTGGEAQELSMDANGTQNGARNRELEPVVFFCRFRVSAFFDTWQCLVYRGIKENPIEVFRDQNRWLLGQKQLRCKKLQRAKSLLFCPQSEGIIVGIVFSRYKTVWAYFGWVSELIRCRNFAIPHAFEAGYGSWSQDYWKYL